MKFQKHINHIITIAILLQIYTIDLIQCTVKKNSAFPVTTPVEIKEANELIKSNSFSTNSPNLTVPHVTEKNSFYLNNPKMSEEVPESVTTGFLILMGAGLIGLCFIIYKAFKLRMSRAERRYGVQGDRSAQELTPLPIAIEEDSDNEDQTIFERNHS